MHFVKHPRLRPARLTPPPEPLGFIERLRRKSLFVWYGVVCIVLLAAIYLLASSN
jgi:hypothetical protein